MPQAVEQLVTALVEAWNTHDVEQVVTFYAPEYQGMDVGNAASQHGVGGIRQMFNRYLRAFPDIRFTADEIVVQDNRAALVWTARGTHQRMVMHIPPTGRSVVVRGASLLTVEDGKIARG